MIQVTVKSDFMQAIASAEAGRTAAVTKATNAMRVKSQKIVPVDTGDLKRSVKVDFDQAPGITSAEVSYNTHYAVFVELGTSKMAAQPYLLPAFHSAKGYLIGGLVKWLRSA